MRRPLHLPRRAPGRVGRFIAWLRPHLEAAAARWVGFVGRAEPVYSLAGPIFEKELRVAGRRARTYFLRLGYLGFLGLMVAMVWLVTVTMGHLFGGGVNYAYRMADAGKRLCTLIVWYLFCTAPLVSLVMLSTSISDEMYRRTLGVLLTTPINSFEIVAGKLLGRLSQVLLLLGMSVPVMLVARLLGGVSWEFVIGGICVTATTALAMGSVGLFFSIGTHRAVLVILKSVIALGAVFALPPLAWPEAFGLVPGAPAGGGWVWLLRHGNPFVGLWWMTADLYRPGWAPAQVFYWPVHCVVMLAACWVLVVISVVRVRQAALDQLMGVSGGWMGRWIRRRSERAGLPLRRVRGSPVVWHALRMRLGSVRLVSVLGWIGGLASLSVTYAVVDRSYGLGDRVVQMVYWLALWSVAVLWTATLAATGIAGEREAGTWPLLMVTPLEAHDIIAGKAIGVFRRCLPAWVLLGYHTAVNVALGNLHPVVVGLLVVQVAGIGAVLTGSGLLVSTFVRRTWQAVALNLGFCVAMWAVVPMVLGMGGYLALGGYLCIHPVAQAVAVLSATAGSENASTRLLEMRFDWFMFSGGGVVAVTVFILSLGGHGALAWVLARWAGKRLRKQVF